MQSSQVSSAGAHAYDRMSGRPAVERSNHHHHHDHKRSERADRPERSDESRPARNPLVAAMMQALKGLAQTSASAPAADEPAATVPAASTTSAPSALSVKEAAMNFANELYGALRAAGGSAPKSQAYGSSAGYGDLAQGLQRLAQSVGAPATPAPAPAPTDGAAPVSAPAVSAQKSAPPEPPRRAQKAAPPEPPVRAQKAAPPEPPIRAQKAAPPEPPAQVFKAAPPEPPRKLSAASPAPAPAAPITINISFNFGGTSAAGEPVDGTPTQAPATEDSPLLKAFKDLMTALNPSASSGTDGAADSASAAQRLQAFLQTLAQSLGGDVSAQAADSVLPAKGSLINLTA